MKACKKCGETKPMSAFYRNKNHSDGREYRCKPCRMEEIRKHTAQRSSDYNRRMNLKAFFGLTPEQYDEIIESQGGLCAICQGPLCRPNLDHCDTTGRIRAVLCQTCNHKLGRVEWVLRRGDFVRRALAYIEGHASGKLRETAKYSGLPARIRRKHRD